MHRPEGGRPPARGQAIRAAGNNTVNDDDTEREGEGDSGPAASIFAAATPPRKRDARPLTGSRAAGP
ncbi:hypothetical protein COO72_11920 [Bifidobacterium callitrichos]|nr:hypothetical protein COO72_11920 [Bifidobacterium callitrichos]